MQCSRCGFSNPAGVNFCGNCGDRLKRACAECGHENIQRARFCTECGALLGNPCPVCGYDNLRFDRFCAECGSQLDKICSECSAINPLHARFCNSCGNGLPEGGFGSLPAPKREIPLPAVKVVSHTEETSEVLFSYYSEQLQKFVPPALRDMYLDARGNIEGEKKIVNMIFSDVSGFTALSEDHADEPEEIQRMINECLKRQAAEVYALEGYVDKFVGDEMVALFGAPIWHEDDAERAVMASIRMRDAVEEYGGELCKEKGVRLQVHIGINTGRVSVGGIGDDMFMNYTVMGDPANLASRIESVAEAGQIIVGELTYKLTKALFDYKEPRFVTVKGKAEPQPVYELIGPKDHPENARGIEGLDAEMIGRAAELNSLMSCMEKALAGRIQITSIVGEAGLGKSRLKEEFRNTVGENATWIEGNCHELTRHAAYSVFLDFIKSQFGVFSSDTEEEIRKKISKGVCQIFEEQDSVSPDQDILPYLFQLMSLKLDDSMADRIKYMLDDPGHLQRQSFLAIKTLLLQIAGENPFVLALEDLHWIDDVSLDLIMFLMESMESSRGLLLCIYRPEKQSACQRIGSLARERFPGDFCEIALNNLSDEDMELLLDSLLPLEETESGCRLRELILRKAEGNPFYLEEVVRTLLEDKAIEEAAGGTGYVIIEKVEDIHVPTGVESIVRAKIDKLTELKDGAKQTLLRASVIGRVFERRVLESISPEHDDLDRHLDRLLAMGLLSSKGSIWPEQEYNFRHILIHDIAYESVIARERRRLHGLVAKRMEELYPESLHPGRLEYIVGHYRLSDDHEKAAIYLIKAGHKARRLYNNAIAIDYYTDALEKIGKLTEVDSKRRMFAEVYEGLGEVYHYTSRFDEALESYEKAMGFCNVAESEAAIYRKMGDIYEKKGDYDRSQKQYESGLALLRNATDSIEFPRLHNGIGFIHYRRGEYSEAIGMCEQALKMLEHKDNYVTLAEIHKNIAINQYLMGKVEAAFENMDLSVQMAEKANDRMLLARLYNTKAVIYQMSGNLDNTIQTFQRILEMRVELGDVDGQATTENSLGMAYTTKGEYDRAISYLDHSLELAQRVGNVRLVADSYMNLGVAYWYTKELDKSIECYQKCLAIYEGIKFARGIATCSGNIAEVYREKGELEEAERYHLETIRMAEKINDREVQGHQYHGLGEIQMTKEDYEKALEYLERALELATELNHREAMGDACKCICEALQKTDRLEEAQEYFDQAREHYAEIGAEAKLRKLIQ